MQEKIINKDEYLKQPIVRRFIKWIVSERLEEVFSRGEEYNWKKEQLDYTYKRFVGWRKTIQKNNEAYKTCYEILEWGGNPVLWNNRKHINNSNGELIDYLKKAKHILLKEVFTEEELKDLHFNSGFTKIYACLDERFLMYDSRVSGAFCKDIACFLISKNIHSVPEELKFTYGSGIGKLNRNPNPPTYPEIRFPNMYQQPHIGLKSNIRFNWIIEELAKMHENAKSNQGSIPKTSFLLQSGYFMLGKEIKYDRNVY